MRTLWGNRGRRQFNTLRRSEGYRAGVAAPARVQLAQARQLPAWRWRWWYDSQWRRAEGGPGSASND